MALASLADVKRVLRIPAASVDTERDDRIRAALAAVESWADTRLWHISAEGEQLEVFWDIPEDATLHLAAPDVTVLKLKVYEYPSSAGVPLSPVELGMGHGYDLSDDGRVFLRPTLTVSPFEGASAQRRLRVYARVEVYYEGTGVIPRAVTEGIAFLAAGHYADGPRALKGLTSEKIGDYSYNLGALKSDSGEPSFVDRALFFLGPYMRKQRVAVI